MPDTVSYIVQLWLHDGPVIWSLISVTDALEAAEYAGSERDANAATLACAVFLTGSSLCSLASSTAISASVRVAHAVPVCDVLLSLHPKMF